MCNCLYFVLFSCRAFNAPYYIGMVVPFLLVYIFNWVIFVIIIASLIHNNIIQSKVKADTKMNKRFFKQQFLIAVTLSILFGLGWGIGLLATQDIHTNKTVRDLFAALFVLTTAFYGVFIFIVRCVRSQEVRNTWKQFFLCVTGKDINELTSSITSHIQHKWDVSGLEKKTTLREVQFSSEAGKYVSTETSIHMEKVVERYPAEMVSESKETCFVTSFPDDDFHEKKEESMNDISMDIDEMLRDIQVKKLSFSDEADTMFPELSVVTDTDTKNEQDQQEVQEEKISFKDQSHDSFIEDN